MPNAKNKAICINYAERTETFIGKIYAQKCLERFCLYHWTISKLER